MKKPEGYEDYDAALLRAHRAAPGTACFIIENLAHYYCKTTGEVTRDYRARFGGWL